MDDFVCKTPPKSIEEWIQQPETPEHCPPCLIQPLGDMYVGTLEEADAKDKVADLKKAWSSHDVLTIARAMDKIKTEVGEPLKNKLIDLDCMTQSFRQTET